MRDENGSIVRYENVLVLILALGGAVAALDGQALFYLSPFVASDLHLNNAEIGLVSTIVLVTWSVAAYLVGLLSDRNGKRKPYLVGAFIVFAACSGLSGIASSYALLLGARLLIGFAEGPVIPLSQSIMMAESSPRRRGLNMGIVQNFGAQLFGSMIGPLIVVRLAEIFSWHAAFFVVGVPGLIVAALVIWFVKEPVARVSDRGSHSKGTQRSIDMPGGSIGAVLSYPNIRACLAVGVFVIGYYFIILTFLPVYCVNVLHMTPARMSLVLSCTGAAGVVSAVIVPYLSDRMGRRPVLGIFSMLGMLAPIGILAVGDSFLPLLGLVFLGSLIVGTTPLFMGTVPMETVLPQYAATASGLILGVGQIVGGFLIPIAAGAVADHFSLVGPMWIALAMAGCAALTSLFIRETAPSRTGMTASIASQAT